MKLRKRKEASSAREDSETKVKRKKSSKTSKKAKVLDEVNEKLKDADKEDLSFVDSVPQADRRDALLELHKLIRKHAPSLEPTTAGHGIHGYGQYRYKTLGQDYNLASNRGNMVMYCNGMAEDGKNVHPRDFWQSAWKVFLWEKLFAFREAFGFESLCPD